jgi:hypothetical protein
MEEYKMANRICRPVTKIPELFVLNATVPVGQTLYAGDVVLVDTLDTNISGNYSVFASTQPATANLGKKMAIVINGGFELLADGRRPEGQPDYSQYGFVAGDVITVILLEEGMRFEISTDSFTGTATLGWSIHPVNGAFKAATAATTPAGTYSSLKTLALKNFRAGGKFGAQFISTVVAMVQQPA